MGPRLMTPSSHGEVRHLSYCQGRRSHLGSSHQSCTLRGQGMRWRSRLKPVLARVTSAVPVFSCRWQADVRIGATYECGACLDKAP
jgi:hypothetical protein